MYLGGTPLKHCLCKPYSTKDVCDLYTFHTKY